jgi:hypothetical protein
MSSKWASANNHIAMLVNKQVPKLQEAQEIVFQVVSFPEIKEEPFKKEGIFAFRIDNNILRSDFQDLTVMVTDYQITRNGLQYSIKYSIYSRLFRRKENRLINGNAPPVEIEVFEILPIDHPDFLSSEDMDELKESLILETCNFWNSSTIN